MATLSLRIDFDAAGRIGPGKIELLERIATSGSISAAARGMKMAFPQARDLVGEIEAVFGKPVLERRGGGRGGGGSSLNTFGHTLVERYRAIERSAIASSEDLLAKLQREVEATPQTDCS